MADLTLEEFAEEILGEPLWPIQKAVLQNPGTPLTLAIGRKR